MLKKTFIVLYIISNLFAVIMMHYDKEKAKKGEERVPEVILMLNAVCLGGAGVYFSMYFFRHKIRKWYFHVGTLAAIIQNGVLFYYIYKISKINL